MTLADIIGDREIWVTGKGGVGKTTTSAALSLNYAKEGEWVLAFDVDGYHSLPDALNAKPQRGHRFRVPENQVYSLANEVGVDLDICLVSPKKIIDHVRANRKTNSSQRANGLPDYFGILHFYDVLEQLGTFVGNEDLATLCLIAAERKIRLDNTERMSQQTRILYDNQSSNATVSLLNRASNAVSRMKVMKDHRIKWSLAAKAAGWGDIASFVNDEYVKHIDTYASEFERLRIAIRDPAQSVYLVVTGARKTELTETERLIGELQESGFPVGALLINKFNKDVDGTRVDEIQSKISTPVFTVSDLPVFEKSTNPHEYLSQFLQNIQPHN